MKKELVLVLALVFLIGCTQQQEIDFTKAQQLIDWSESFPRYYSSENIAPQFQEQIELSLETQDMKDCQKIVEFVGEETEKEFLERVEALHQCSNLLTKKKAFSQKDISDCDNLYGRDNLAYEECVAPIATFLSIVKDDKGLCKRNLNNGELIKICEGDYEKFN